MFYNKVIIQKNLIADNDNLLIGVSGGPDSMALLYFMLMIKEKYNLEISVAHINHHTRKNENEVEQDMIEKFCSDNNVPCYVGHFIKKSKNNFHDESRSFRYRYFFNIAKKITANKIVLAHHQDDQVETMLFKITRGNNISGYIGMKAQIKLGNNIKLIRPLLNVTKSEIMDYCHKYNVPYAIDSSNLTDKYTRNYLRNNIIPLFKTIQPDFNDKMIQFHEQLKEADDYLQVMATKLTEEMIISCETDRIILDLTKLKTTHKALIRYILLNVVNNLANKSFNLTYEKFKNLFSIIFNKKPNITFDLGKNMYCIREYDKLIFQKGLEDINKYVVVVDEFKDYLLPNGVKIRVKKIEEKAKINNKTLILCYNNTVWPLVIRTKNDGDFIQTKVGKKKINRVFIDAKIPINLRKNWPLLVDKKGDIIWVIGIQKPDFSKFPSCKQFIKIELIN